MIVLKKIKSFTKRAYLLNHYPKFFSVIFSNKKKLIYYGFLGDGNFGDEMVFLATKKLFKDCVIIPYKRHMPILIMLYCRFFSDSLDGIIIGGGTLIRSFNADKSYFKKLVEKGKPVFFHGTGADEQLIDKVFWPSFLESDYYGGLRGPESQLTLKKNGFNFKQIGDASLYLKGSSNQIKKEKLIVVNFGTHKENQDLLYSRKQIIKFLNGETVKGYRIVYLPFHSIDYDLGKLLQFEVDGLEVLDIAVSYQETLNLMESAEFCVGERLHFTVMSVLSNINFVSINYDDKHVDFLKSLGLERLGFYPNDVSDKIIESVFNNEKEHVKWHKVNHIINELSTVRDSEKSNFLNKMNNRN